MRKQFQEKQSISATAHVQNQYYPYDKPCGLTEACGQADITEEFEPGPDVRSEIYL